MKKGIELNERMTEQTNDSHHQPKNLQVIQAAADCFITFELFKDLLMLAGVTIRHYYGDPNVMHVYC